jgi:hydrogenase maturation protease
MRRVLVIGYGNPLRGDDGLGIAAVEMLMGRVEAGLCDPGVAIRFKAVYQLTPEIAADLAGADFAVFIDAACDNVQGDIIHRRVLPSASALDSFSHQLTPEVLLALAERLYGRSPEAYLYSIGAASFEYGETLSEPVRAALPALVDQIQAACFGTQS